MYDVLHYRNHYWGHIELNVPPVYKPNEMQLMCIWCTGRVCIQLNVELKHSLRLALQHGPIHSAVWCTQCKPSNQFSYSHGIVLVNTAMYYWRHIHTGNRVQISDRQPSPTWVTTGILYNLLCPMEMMLQVQLMYALFNELLSVIISVDGYWDKEVSIS